MKIIHHENGDSEFIILTKMQVGVSDEGTSHIVIGSGFVRITLSIYQEDKNRFRVWENTKSISDVMETKEDCIKWIIQQIQGEQTCLNS